MDELAKGERKSANKIHIGVALKKKISLDEQKAGARKIRQTLGLKSHHPLKISFIKTDEKDKLLKHSPKKL